jgi:hypothetical protein
MLAVTGRREAHLFQARAPTLRRTQMMLRVSDTLVKGGSYDEIFNACQCIEYGI